MAFSQYLKTAVLNAVYRGVTYTSPANTYLSLHLTPGADGSTAAWVATELNPASALSYARATVTTSQWAAPTGTTTITTATNATISFPAATSNWGLVTWVGVWDSATVGAGNLLDYIQVPGSGKTVNNGDVAQFTGGNLTIGMT